MSTSASNERVGRYVSTGRLRSAADVQMLVDDAHVRFRDDDAGENSDAYPALTHTPRGLFGICIAATEGRMFAAGDVDRPQADRSDGDRRPRGSRFAGERGRP